MHWAIFFFFFRAATAPLTLLSAKPIHKLSPNNEIWGHFSSSSFFYLFLVVKLGDLFHS